MHGSSIIEFVPQKDRDLDAAIGHVRKQYEEITLIMALFLLIDILIAAISLRRPTKTYIAVLFVNVLRICNEYPWIV